MGSFLSLIASRLGIKMTMDQPPDGHWGHQLDDKSWAGMVGMLTRDEADFIVEGLFLLPGFDQVINPTTGKPHFDSGMR